MELKDLLMKPVNLMSTEELLQGMNELRKLGGARMAAELEEKKKGAKVSAPKIKTNETKRVENLISGLSKEQMEQLALLLQQQGVIE